MQFCGSIVACASSGSAYSASTRFAAPSSALSASPSPRTTFPLRPAAFASAASISALLSFAFGPGSQSIFSAARPVSAAQVDEAATQTPPHTWLGGLAGAISKTFVTPGTASAAVASNDLTFPPNAGGRATTAWSIPGRRTSRPYSAAPRAIAALSTRSCALPTMRKADGSLSRGLSGTRSAAAASASSP